MSALALDFSAFESDMDDALNRLDALVQRQLAAQAVQASPDGQMVSFDVSEHPILEETLQEKPPEVELLSLMGEAEKAEASSEAVSFGIGETVSGALGQAQVEFDAFMEKINRDVLNFAHVESGAADSPFAFTRVDWSGDALTVIDAHTSPEKLREHSQHLHKELLARNLRLRMFTTVATAASKITLMMSNPATAVMALPMAYSYVSQLSEQWKAFQSLNQP